MAINLLLEFFQDDAASIFGGGFVRDQAQCFDHFAVD